VYPKVLYNERKKHVVGEREFEMKNIVEQGIYSGIRWKRNPKDVDRFESWICFCKYCFRQSKEMGKKYVVH